MARETWSKRASAFAKANKEVVWSSREAEKRGCCETDCLLEDRNALSVIDSNQIECKVRIVESV